MASVPTRSFVLQTLTASSRVEQYLVVFEDPGARDVFLRGAAPHDSREPVTGVQELLYAADWSYGCRAYEGGSRVRLSLMAGAARRVA